MIKNFLIAAALVIASPALVFSQDIFVSFDSASNLTSTSGNVGDTGTAYIYSDLLFGFDALDLDFTSSDSSVLLLTGGTAINGASLLYPGGTFNSTVATIADSGANGNLFAVNISAGGIDPSVNAVPQLATDALDVGPGSSGSAVRLVEITYEIAGAGTATLDLSLGSQGVLILPGNPLDPLLGSATITGIPEPSSATLLVLSAVGMVARRRKPRA